jgi:hypothetical protein
MKISADFFEKRAKTFPADGSERNFNFVDHNFAWLTLFLDGPDSVMVNLKADCKFSF